MNNTEKPAQAAQTVSFSDFPIAKNVLEIVSKLGFTTPTPIQASTLPALLAGDDVVGVAQTGTGKTLAFGIPMLQRIGETKKLGLVILPTRELAAQVEESIRKVGGPLGLRTAVIIGGVSQDRQIKALRAKPHVIIGTPGRILDLLHEGHLRFDQVGYCVLDEADRMFDMGFAPQIEKILQAVPKPRQMALFSATMPKPILALATKYMQSPTHIEIAPQGTTAKNIQQELFLVNHNDKLRALATVLAEEKGTVIIFSRTKHGASKLTIKLHQLGYSAAEIHGNRSQGQRTRALDGFRNGTTQILVATDIAARGIDVPNVSLVVNYDLPDNMDEYVHRIGRTGRAGATGRALSFVARDQKQSVRIIERTINRSLKLDTLQNILSEADLEVQREAVRVKIASEPPKRLYDSSNGGGHRGGSRGGSRSGGGRGRSSGGGSRSGGYQGGRSGGRSGGGSGRPQGGGNSRGNYAGGGGRSRGGSSSSSSGGGTSSSGRSAGGNRSARPQSGNTSRAPRTNA